MWENIILSTTSSIARFEKEVNRQAGFTVRWSIYTENNLLLDIPQDLVYTKIIAQFPGGEEEINQVSLPANKNIIKLTFFEEDRIVAVFNLDEGKGNIIKSEDGNYIIRIVDEEGNPVYDIWQEVEIDITWDAKIQLAKDMLKYEIETALTEMNYYVDEFAGKRLIDIISNPETFSLASDYLTLHLIYTDLANGGFNELFQNKADYYWKRYKQELNNCFKRLNIDYNQTGNPIYRVKIEGYVSR